MRFIKSKPVFIIFSTFLLGFLIIMQDTVRVNAGESGQATDVRQGAALTNKIQILYNERNGLPTSEANTVIQTSDGYVWIGSYGGLVRYDGREFRNYSTEKNGLDSSGIRALLQDSGGRMWVGTNARGVYLYENGEFSECPAVGDVQYDSVRCFAEASDGSIYVGTTTGLANIEGNGMLSPVMLPELSDQTIYSLSFDENGILWGTAGDGIAFALKDGEIVYLFKPGDLNDYENYSLLADGKNIYIGTGGNILLSLTLTDDKYGPSSYKIHTFFTGSLQTINALCLTGDGNLWIGANTGSGWFDSSMKLHVLEDMEQNTFISSITQDYEGNLWLASTQGGVFQLTWGLFYNANKAAGLEDKSVNALVRVDGSIYVGTDYGLYITDEEWNPVKNDLTDKLSDVRIRHLFMDSKSNLWISTYSQNALVRYTPATGELLDFNEKNGLLSDKVRQVIELGNGDIAVATMAGINLIRDDQVTGAYGQEQGIVNPMILCLLEASDGSLLAGSDGRGIYVISDGKVTNVGKAQGLTSGVVLRMREDREADGIWISAGSELFFMGEGGAVQEVPDFQYGSGSIFDILVMDDDIWLVKSSRLIIVPRASLLGKQEMTAVEYGLENGLSANLVANSWNLFDNGILYLCSVDGVFVLDSRNMPVNNIPPKTAVSEILIQRENGKTEVVRSPQKIILPSDARRVTINFSCLAFGAAPSTVTYYLEGFDDLPVSDSSQETGSVSYTNLDGGKYIFHLKATNADGKECDIETTVLIEQEPGLLEMPVVWIGLALLTVLLFVLTARLFLEVKTRKIRRRQQEYREITDQALNTIANTIDAKDKYTNGHSVRVAGYSRELARRMGMKEDEQENVYYIALLHDIGKIGIPDAILNKPGALTDEEFATMKSHTRIGGEILSDFTALPQIGEGALSHHENLDGSGYPEHRKGEEIPLVARIIRVADSYDAMATNRSYRGPQNREYILSEFRKYCGSYYEPRIAQLMIDMIEEGFEV